MISTNHEFRRCESTPDRMNSSVRDAMEHRQIIEGSQSHDHRNRSKTLAQVVREDNRLGA